jgi:phytol kinase
MIQGIWLAGVLVFLGLLFLIEKKIRLRFELSPESSRKFIHAGIGVVTATFPLYFTDNWPVVTLTILSIGLLLYVRLYLKDSLGSALHGVKRMSIGEFVFPLGILVCWMLSHQNGLFYSISILVLTFADAFAALIGVKYGRIKYSTKEGFKSWEGSLAFFITAFLCVHIPLLLASNIGRIECILISIMVGFIIMLLEAFSWRGLDNLFIPITTLFLLFRYENQSAHILLIKLVVLLGLLLFVYLLRKKSSLDDSSLFAAALVIYLSFVLGGNYWALAPAIVFVSYQWCFPTEVQNSHNEHDIVLLLYIAVPALIWLVFYQIAPSEKYFSVFVICFLNELVCLGFSRIIYLNENISGFHAAVRASGISLLLFVPYFFILPHTASLLLIIFAFAAGFLIHLLYGKMKQEPVTTKRWVIQTLVCFVLSIFGLMLL